LSNGSHPVVVVGPLLGQSLEVLNSDDRSWCHNKGEWTWTWGNPKAMSKISDLLCLLGDLGLQGWDDKEKLSIPWPKIKVRPRGGYGHYDGSAFEAMFGMLEGDGHLTMYLEKKGYEKEETYFAHAYDWRLGVHDWEVTSFPALRKVIEKATWNAGGTPVVLTGLSMAGPYTHSFLTWAREEDPTWTSRHVHAFVPVSGPWNGAVQALSAVLSSALETYATSGDCPHCIPAKHNEMFSNETGSLIGQFKKWWSTEAKDKLDEVLTRLVQTWPSIYYMSTAVDYSTEPPTDRKVVTMLNGAIPDVCTAEPETSTKCGSTVTRGGWEFDDPKFLSRTQCAECHKVSKFSACSQGFEKTGHGFIHDLCCKRHTCDAKTYRASELPTLFAKIGAEKHAQLMAYAGSVGTTSDPGVPVHCIFSHNVQTFNELRFATREDLDKPSVILDDGDMTVDAHSLEVCTRWKSTVKTYKLPGVKHSGMLDVEQVLEVIVAVATNDDKAWKSWKEPAYSELKWTSNASLATISEFLVAPEPQIVSVV